MTTAINSQTGSVVVSQATNKAVNEQAGAVIIYKLRIDAINAQSGVVIIAKNDGVPILLHSNPQLYIST